jgi:uncharacterized membrane protein
MKRGKLLAIVLILGIIDSLYLTVVHFLPSVLKCPIIGTVVNCENVLTSSFSTVFGIPLATLGLVWFIASLLFLVFGYNKIIKNLWMILGVGGIIYSIVAQTIVGKVCVYCVALDVLIALSVGLFVYIKDK